MGHFFIAYSRRDFYFAESLFYALQSKGINAWMDVWKITPGDDWDKTIANAIQSSQGFILIATKESLQSSYVKKEICRAVAAETPIYLVIRGGFSKQDLRIYHKDLNKEGINYVDEYARVIIDMRADFTKGLEKIIAAIVTNVVYPKSLPGIFNFKMEKILYIPPILVFLTLLMVITEFWKFGAGFFYLDQLDQLMSYIRDIIHGATGELLLLSPMLIEGIVTIGSLVNIIIFAFNFSRRKSVGANHFVLLLTSVVVTGLITLPSDVIAVTMEAMYFLSPVADFLKQGESPPLDKALLLLLVLHGILFLLIVIMEIAFGIMFYASDGRGAILRWLPTGYASEKIRHKGNEAWIKNLPAIEVSQRPLYRSYAIVASPADSSTKKNIRAILQQEGYAVIDDLKDAVCDLVILSPFSKDNYYYDYKEDYSKPVIYVVSRSMKSPDPEIAVQWIDYRRQTKDQFWKQWEKEFYQLKNDSPVFPYVPETLGASLIPRKYGCGIWFMTIAVMLGSALLVSGMEYIALLRNAVNGLALPISIALMVGSIGISYYTVAQMIRGIIAPKPAKLRLGIAGILTIIAAFILQSPLLIISSLCIVLINIFMADRPSLRRWLPPQSRKSNKKSLFQPIRNYKIFTSYGYSSIMILGFLALNALITNSLIIPKIPPQFASKPYAVTVPGPYYLGAPGLWSQDPYASAFGYHFDYHPDKLNISQDQVTGYPTWLKFLGINSSPMRFAPHFSSSIHVHFTNNEVRTDFGLVLNDFVKMNPGDPIGPQLRLAASGLWTVIESNGNHYSGQIAKNELSQDYTLEVEVNGILCTYKINGKKITTIAEKSLSSIKDIMFSFATIVPGGTTYDLSNFTYTPIAGPILTREQAIKLIAASNAAPYTTIAPGWHCNPNDGRWNAGYEPAEQNTHLTCTTTATRLNTSARYGVLLNFDNNAFGGLPEAFDYSFKATFQDAYVQCIDTLTFANVTPGIAYAYVFVICSDGTWATKYIGYHTENFSVFLNKRLKSGHIHIKTTLAIFVEFRSTTQTFYINHQLITSYMASDLKPTILFGNDKGAVLYSNFSYVPKTQ